MKARTEELLYFLLWSAEQLTRPTFRNLDESFEGWAYRNGFLRQLALLEKRKFLEQNSAKQRASRLYRLTAEGRLYALGGRDPETEWSRSWDGTWRLVLFDVPVADNAQRARVRRYLRARGFGYLQNSVWITPGSLDEEAKLLRSAKIDVESLILMEAQPCAGESDAEIVAGAWDFEQINHLYARYLRILSQRPSGKLKNELEARAMQNWGRAEREAWNAAIQVDPLLPEELLPPRYLGRRAWQRRTKALGKAQRDLVSFQP